MAPKIPAIKRSSLSGSYAASNINWSEEPPEFVQEALESFNQEQAAALSPLRVRISPSFDELDNPVSVLTWFNVEPSQVGRVHAGKEVQRDFQEDQLRVYHDPESGRLGFSRWGYSSLSMLAGQLGEVRTDTEQPYTQQKEVFGRLLRERSLDSAHGFWKTNLHQLTPRVLATSPEYLLPAHSDYGLDVALTRNLSEELQTPMAYRHNYVFAAHEREAGSLGQSWKDLARFNRPGSRLFNESFDPEPYVSSAFSFHGEPRAEGTPETVVLGHDPLLVAEGGGLSLADSGYVMVQRSMYIKGSTKMSKQEILNQWPVGTFFGREQPQYLPPGFTFRQETIIGGTYNLGNTPLSAVLGVDWYNGEDNQQTGGAVVHLGDFYPKAYSEFKTAPSLKAQLFATGPDDPRMQASRDKLGFFPSVFMAMPQKGQRIIELAEENLLALPAGDILGDFLTAARRLGVSQADAMSLVQQQVSGGSWRSLKTSSGFSTDNPALRQTDPASFQGALVAGQQPGPLSRALFAQAAMDRLSRQTFTTEPRDYSVNMGLAKRLVQTMGEEPFAERYGTLPPVNAGDDETLLLHNYSYEATWANVLGTHQPITSSGSTYLNPTLADIYGRNQPALLVELMKRAKAGEFPNPATNTLRAYLANQMANEGISHKLPTVDLMSLPDSLLNEIGQFSEGEHSRYGQEALQSISNAYPGRFMEVQSRVFAPASDYLGSVRRVTYDRNDEATEDTMGADLGELLWQIRRGEVDEELLNKLEMAQAMQTLGKTGKKGRSLSIRSMTGVQSGAPEIPFGYAIAGEGYGNLLKSMKLPKGIKQRAISRWEEEGEGIGSFWMSQAHPGLTGTIKVVSKTEALSRGWQVQSYDIGANQYLVGSEMALFLFKDYDSDRSRLFPTALRPDQVNLQESNPLLLGGSDLLEWNRKVLNARKANDFIRESQDKGVYGLLSPKSGADYVRSAEAAGFSGSEMARTFAPGTEYVGAMVSQISERVRLSPADTSLLMNMSGTLISAFYRAAMDQEPTDVPADLYYLRGFSDLAIGNPGFTAKKAKEKGRENNLFMSGFKGVERGTSDEQLYGGFVLTGDTAMMAMRIYDRGMYLQMGSMGKYSSSEEAYMGGPFGQGIAEMLAHLLIPVSKVGDKELVHTVQLALQEVYHSVGGKDPGLMKNPAGMLTVLAAATGQTFHPEHVNEFMALAEAQNTLGLYGSPRYKGGNPIIEAVKALGVGAQGLSNSSLIGDLLTSMGGSNTLEGWHSTPVLPGSEIVSLAQMGRRARQGSYFRAGTGDLLDKATAFGALSQTQSWAGTGFLARQLTGEEYAPEGNMWTKLYQAVHEHNESRPDRQNYRAYGLNKMLPNKIIDPSGEGFAEGGLGELAVPDEVPTLSRFLKRKQVRGMGLLQALVGINDESQYTGHWFVNYQGHTLLDESDDRTGAYGPKDFSEAYLAGRIHPALGFPTQVSRALKSYMTKNAASLPPGTVIMPIPGNMESGAEGMTYSGSPVVYMKDYQSLRRSGMPQDKIFGPIYQRIYGSHPYSADLESVLTGIHELTHVQDTYSALDVSHYEEASLYEGIDNATRAKSALGLNRPGMLDKLSYFLSPIEQVARMGERSYVQSLSEHNPQGLDSGGFTGKGGKYQPAGVVHAGEYVLSQEDVAAIQAGDGGYILKKVEREVKKISGDVAEYWKGGLVRGNYRSFASGGMPWEALGETPLMPERAGRGIPPSSVGGSPFGAPPDAGDVEGRVPFMPEGLYMLGSQNKAGKMVFRLGPGDETEASAHMQMHYGSISYGEGMGADELLRNDLRGRIKSSIAGLEGFLNLSSAERSAVSPQAMTGLQQQAGFLQMTKQSVLSMSAVELKLNGMTDVQSQLSSLGSSLEPWQIQGYGMQLPAQSEGVARQMAQSGTSQGFSEMGKFLTNLKDMGSLLDRVNKGHEQYNKQVQGLVDIFDKTSQTLSYADEQSKVLGRGNLPQPLRDILDTADSTGLRGFLSGMAPAVGTARVGLMQAALSGQGNIYSSEEERQGALQSALFASGPFGRRQRKNLPSEAYEGGLDTEFGTVTGRDNIDAVGALGRIGGRARQFAYSSAHAMWWVGQPIQEQISGYEQSELGRGAALMQAGAYDPTAPVNGTVGAAMSRQSQIQLMQRQSGGALATAYAGVAGGMARPMAQAMGIIGPALAADMVVGSLGLGEFAGPVAGIAAGTLAFANYASQIAGSPVESSNARVNLAQAWQGGLTQGLLGSVANIGDTAAIAYQNVFRPDLAKQSGGLATLRNNILGQDDQVAQANVQLQDLENSPDQRARRDLETMQTSNQVPMLNALQSGDPEAMAEYSRRRTMYETTQTQTGSGRRYASAVSYGQALSQARRDPANASSSDALLAGVAQASSIDYAMGKYSLSDQQATDLVSSNLRYGGPDSVSADNKFYQQQSALANLGYSSYGFGKSIAQSMGYSLGNDAMVSQFAQAATGSILARGSGAPAAADELNFQIQRFAPINAARAQAGLSPFNPLAVGDNFGGDPVAMALQDQSWNTQSRTTPSNLSYNGRQGDRYTESTAGILSAASSLSYSQAARGDSAGAIATTQAARNQAITLGQGYQMASGYDMLLQQMQPNLSAAQRDAMTNPIQGMGQTQQSLLGRMMSGDAYAATAMYQQTSGKFGANLMDTNTGYRQMTFSIDQTQYGQVADTARQFGQSQYLMSQQQLSGGVASLQGQLVQNQYAQANLQYQSQQDMTRMGLQLMTGGATSLNKIGMTGGGDSFNGDGLKALQALLGSYGQSFNPGNGMGQWQIEDVQTGITREQQDWGQSQEGRRLGISRQQYEVGTAFQRSEMNIQQEHTTIQQGWQMQDLQFGRSVMDVQFGWQQEDYSRNIRYARGREKRDLMREQQRSTVMYAMEAGHESTQENRLQQQTQWEQEEFNRQRSYFEQRVQWDGQLLQMSEQDHQKNVQWLQETRALEDQSRLISRQWLVAQQEISLQLNQKFFELQNNARLLSTNIDLVNQSMTALYNNFIAMINNGNALNPHAGGGTPGPGPGGLPPVTGTHGSGGGGGSIGIMSITRASTAPSNVSSTDLLGQISANTAQMIAWLKAIASKDPTLVQTVITGASAPTISLPLQAKARLN